MCFQLWAVRGNCTVYRAPRQICCITRTSSSTRHQTVQTSWIEEGGNVRYMSSWVDWELLKYILYKDQQIKFWFFFWWTVDLFSVMWYRTKIMVWSDNRSRGNQRTSSKDTIIVVLVVGSATRNLQSTQRNLLCSIQYISPCLGCESRGVWTSTRSRREAQHL